MRAVKKRAIVAGFLWVCDAYFVDKRYGCVSLMRLDKSGEISYAEGWFTILTTLEYTCKTLEVQRYAPGMLG